MKIAFVYRKCSPFIKNDYELINKHFKVESVQCNSIRDVLKLFKVIKRSDIVYSWFVGTHSFLALLIANILGKKTIAVAGGGDVAREPAIAYGQFTQSWLKRFCARFTLNHSDMVLAVSNFTKAEVLMHAKPKQLKTVYNGIDVQYFKPNGIGKNIVTVAKPQGHAIALKGLITFALAAKRLQHLNFYILGCSEKDRAALNCVGIPKNLTILGRQTPRELLKHFQQSKVYCALSYRESFGVAVAEAMACGCVPVATNRGALPEVIGTVGVTVDYADTKATVEAINTALILPNRSREQITDNFSLDLREHGLLHVFDFLSRNKSTRLRLEKTAKVANVQSGGRVLDLGCGTKVLKALLPSDIEYTGIDQSGIPDITYDLEQGLPDGLDSTTIPNGIKTLRYDVIFLNEFIEHIENFKTLLEDCESVLKEDGKILISTPSNNRIIVSEDKSHIHCFRPSNMYNLARILRLVLTGVYGFSIRFPPIIGLTLKINSFYFSDGIIYKFEKPKLLK